MGDALVGEKRPHQAHHVIDRPSRCGECPAQPSDQLRQMLTPVIRPYPQRSAPENDAANRLRVRRRHQAIVRVSLPIAEVISGLVGERTLRPVEDAERTGQHDFAVFAFPGKPIGVFRAQIRIIGIEHADQRKPAAAGNRLLVRIDQLIKIVADAKMNPHAPHSPVALQNEPRQQWPRTMLDRQRVRQAQVVFGDDIREIERHGQTRDRPFGRAGNRYCG